MYHPSKNKAGSDLHEPGISLIPYLDFNHMNNLHLVHMNNIFTSLTTSIAAIFGTMAASEAKFRVERASGLTVFQPKGKFPFTSLPFEMQKEVFQYLLVATDDQVIRPEKLHGIENSSCYQHRGLVYTNYYPYFEKPPPPIALDCYHKTLETQLLTVSHNTNAVAVQVLYGCNRFHVRIVISYAGAACRKC